MSSPESECCESRAHQLVHQPSMAVAELEGLRSRRESLVLHPVLEQDWQEAIQQIPVDLEASARHSGALVRRRGVKRAEDLLRMALAYALCDWPLRIVAAWACLKGWAELSDTALLWRLCSARVWLGLLLASWVLRDRIQLPARPVRVRLIDASVINGPRSQGTDWRLHVSLDLGRGYFDEVELSDSKGGETLVRHGAGSGDILVADRGYGHANGIGRVLAWGAELVVRITIGNLRIYDETGVKLELLEWLGQAPDEEPMERRVVIKTQDGEFPLRLIAKRLSQQAAERARRRLRRQSSRNGRTPNQRSLEAAGFIVLMSNLDPQGWSASEIMALYRLRWQVEMAFKRLKGVLNLDHLRAENPDLAQTYLLSKLLGALMADRMSNGPAVSIDWFDSLEHPVSPWRWLVLWSDALRRAVQGSLSLGQLLAALPKLRRYLCDSPRRRKQQYALGRRLMQLLNRVSSADGLGADQLLQPATLC